MQSRDGDETLEGGHPAQNYPSFQAGGWGGGLFVLLKPRKAAVRWAVCFMNISLFQPSEFTNKFHWKKQIFRSGSAVYVITKAYFLRRGWAISSCSSEFTVLLSLCQGNIATSSYKMKRKWCFDSVDFAWFAATCPSPTPQTHSKYQNVRCLPSNVSPWATLYLLKRLRAAKKYWNCKTGCKSQNIDT